jgi:hypothetical protein
MTIIIPKWKKFLKEGSFDFEALKPKDKLEPSFWLNNDLNPRVLKQLLTIAQDIINSMDIQAKIKDVTFTGSLASHNWHALSDIDLHIVFDFSEIDENIKLVKRMLDQSRINWNKVHDIIIEGHEVELYFQDVNERHESLGVYSILNGQWVMEPSKMNVDIDLRSTEKKAEALQNNIRHISNLFSKKEYKEAYEYASKVKEKIRRMRSAGLSREGVYSAENLAFKMLRNGGELEKLSSLKVSSYDKMMSLKVTEQNITICDSRWAKFLKNV